jgi:hypothetical protein
MTYGAPAPNSRLACMPSVAAWAATQSQGVGADRRRREARTGVSSIT